MTSLQFMKEQFGVNDGKERFCASIHKDGAGTIYSYGEHYPLLFKVKGQAFINVTGYSVTTSRHISWAWAAVDYTAIAVELGVVASQVITAGYPTSENQKLEAITKCLEHQLNTLKAEIGAKKRKDTWVYANLERRIAIVAYDLASVKALL